MPIDLETLNPLYRDVFNDSKSGTPDNISQAGCVALAQLGSIAWNAWRKDFPTTGGRISRGYGVTSEYRNFANFSNHIFDGPVDFSNFDFGPHAAFENTEFKQSALFPQSKFGEEANFELAKFQAEAIFEKASFEDGVTFVCANFKSLAFFQYAKLGGKADFAGVTFSGQTNFDQILFGHTLIFDHAIFDLPIVTFTAGNWDEFLAVYSIEESADIRRWAEKRNVRPGKMSCASFGGAEFKGTVDFSGIEFSGRTQFTKSSGSRVKIWAEKDDDGHTKPAGNGRIKELAVFKEKKGAPLIFGAPPIFHNCKFNQNISFDGAKFPKATGHESSIRAYRTLKLALSQQQAVREEQRFFQLEMAEETKYASWRQRSWYEAYRLLSNYGFSIWRPLAMLFIAWLLFAATYGSLANLTICLPFQAGCSINSAWLEFSLLQALPLPGVDKLEVDLHKELFVPKAAPIWVTMTILFHKTISLLALFLTGLALRNLFKMK
jgi:uncharacterized protein YjbI with pentapeptide repeats